MILLSNRKILAVAVGLDQNLFWLINPMFTEVHLSQL